MSWVHVDDYRFPDGWLAGTNADERARWYCQQLEAGRILFFPGFPFDLPEADRSFLVAQRQSTSPLHKNISYRPQQDLLRGIRVDKSQDVQQMHAVMRRYSAQVTAFLTQFLLPYAPHWSLDYASFRPVEEAGRNLPIHKRNDLLHVDAFPSRPTGGSRILRVFSNVNPTQSRVWLTTTEFRTLAGKFAEEAGLSRIATASGSPLRSLIRPFASAARALGVRIIDRSPYDQFMLRFHDYLKENAEFQRNTEQIRIEFPPYSTWIVFTDAVSHAVLSGQYALEQTYIIPDRSMVSPQEAPIHILEQLCGQPLSP